MLGIIGGIFMIGVLSGCETKDQAELEQSFEKELSIYPTKNLLDFYDMEGYRDDEFDKDDKGVWVLSSSMGITKNDDAPLVNEGIVLRMNRNTRTAKGFYYVRSYTEDDIEKDTKEEFPVTYDEKGFHLTKEVSDPELKEKILNFQFFVQYGVFDKLDSYKNIKKMYNPEVPMYNLEYQLTNDDKNVKELRKRYDIPTKEAPTLVLSGRGSLEGSSVGSKELTFQFTKKPPVYFTDSIDYQRSNEEDIINE
ncbi:tandem-type lipoprotein [Enterococcus sp. S22(2020)]|nr:tandem-type lipoprotein [Enterococcus sp. S22(2020)]MCA5011392.1 tandem-type lipoprotein [Enterococcus sp. S23]MCA5015166.1 tandem-type lipoprotein [Enterococcus sp. S22(2020)]